MPGGGGGQSQVTVPFFRPELAVRAFWPKAILCRLAFKGLCLGAWDQIKYNFVNSWLRSHQKMPLLQRSKAIPFGNLNKLKTCISLIKCVHCPLSICGFSGSSFAEHGPIFFKQFFSLQC